MDAARASAVVAGAALGAAIAWSASSDVRPLTLPGPARDHDAVDLLIARQDAVPAFAEVDINEANPFLPWQLRAAQGGVGDAGDAPNDDVTSGGGREPDPVPPLRLPLRPSSSPVSPACVGLIAHARGRSLLVRVDRATARPVAIGGEIAGWRLETIDGGIARWRDPVGGLRDLVIAAAADD